MATNRYHPLKFPPTDSVALACRIATRPSATFFNLDVIEGRTPPPGTYVGEVEVGDTRAPCGLRVVNHLGASGVWCQPRGPLAPTRPGMFVHAHVTDACRQASIECLAA